MANVTKLGASVGATSCVWPAGRVRAEAGMVALWEGVVEPGVARRSRRSDKTSITSCIDGRKGVKLG